MVYNFFFSFSDGLFLRIYVVSSHLHQASAYLQIQRPEASSLVF